MRVYPPTRNFKIGSFDHNIATTGIQTITGVGFKPRMVLFFGVVDATNMMTIGGDDTTSKRALYRDGFGGYTFEHYENVASMFYYDNGKIAWFNIQSFDNDGFTILWEKLGLPVGTASMVYVAFG